MVDEKYQIHGVKVTGIYIYLWAKKLNLFIFTHALSKTLPKVLITTPGRRKLPTFPNNYFFPAKMTENYAAEKNDQN